jgi:hypothetical protein
MTIAIVLAFLKRFWLPITITLIIIGGVFFARSCYVNYKQEQAQQELNEERQKVINAIVAEEVADVEGHRESANTAGDNTNQALDVLEKARSLDTNKSNSNAAQVKERFCKLYPEDSVCQ